MTPPIKVAVLVVALISSSCDAYRWPPFEGQLAEMFRDNVETMVAIEQEMIADGRSTAGSGLAQKRQLSREGEPELTPEQLDKYSQLFQDLGFDGRFLRIDDTTQIRLRSQRVRSRDYYVSFVHTDQPLGLETCAVVDRSSKCGECYESLQTDWIVYYRWFPKLDTDTLNECANER